MRSLLLSLHILFYYYFVETADVFIVDQLSVSIPILRFTNARILFYCHYPDKLLSKRTSLLKRIYRVPVDFIEELTTKMADDIVVNSEFTASVFNESFTMIKKIPSVLYPAIAFDAYDIPFDENDVSVKKLMR